MRESGKIHDGRSAELSSKGVNVVILGVVLVILGLVVASLHVLLWIGIALLILGVVLNLVPIGGTRRRVF
jgi:membrane-bound ClpP family serine protease